MSAVDRYAGQLEGRVGSIAQGKSGPKSALAHFRL